MSNELDEGLRGLQKALIVLVAAFGALTLLAILSGGSGPEQLLH